MISSASKPGSGGIPQREGGDAIGVDILGALLEFGEPRQVIACRLVLRAIDLQEDRAISLHDEWGVNPIIHIQ